MLVNQISLINTIAEVTAKENGIVIDHGNLTLELTYLEGESLLLNLLTVYPKYHGLIESVRK